MMKARNTSWNFRKVHSGAIKLSPGKHEIKISLNGCQEWSWTIQITAGGNANRAPHISVFYPLVGESMRSGAPLVFLSFLLLER